MCSLKAPFPHTRGGGGGRGGGLLPNWRLACLLPNTPISRLPDILQEQPVPGYSGLNVSENRHFAYWRISKIKLFRFWFLLDLYTWKFWFWHFIRSQDFNFRENHIFTLIPIWSSKKNGWDLSQCNLAAELTAMKVSVWTISTYIVKPDMLKPFSDNFKSLWHIC